MRRWCAIYVIMHCLGVTSFASAAEPVWSTEKANTDESNVPPYTLPDPLVDSAGDRVTTIEKWRSKRRPELLQLFEQEEYGRAPTERPTLKFTTTSEDNAALGGKAIRKEVMIDVSTPRGHVPLHLLLYIPKDKKHAPCFLGLNFHGNQVVVNDPGITLATCWVLNQPTVGIVENRATEASRGSQAANWQVEEVIGRGYAVATMCCGDIEPDSPDGLAKGVRALFLHAGQDKPADEEWGTIAAWAWGLSRALDFLETEPLVDAKRVAVWGHSRLGKAAVWAGAEDERFALVISNNSGCGGAALCKRVFGETVGIINDKFPHWFCGNFKKYSQNEAELPIDQHELIALIAPRPVYVASATEDRWADPRGEFLSAMNAEPVYRLLGCEGLGADEMPTPDRSIGSSIGYHVRTGKHETTAFDWQQYLKFADLHLREPSIDAGPSPKP